MKKGIKDLKRVLAGATGSEFHSKSAIKQKLEEQKHEHIGIPGPNYPILQIQSTSLPSHSKTPFRPNLRLSLDNARKVGP